MLLKYLRTHAYETEDRRPDTNNIPTRTLEDWERGVRSCPDYLRLLLAQASGLYTRP